VSGGGASTVAFKKRRKLSTGLKEEGPSERKGALIGKGGEPTTTRKEIDSRRKKEKGVQNDNKKIGLQARVLGGKGEKRAQRSDRADRFAATAYGGGGKKVFGQEREGSRSRWWLKPAACRDLA